jgi:hypothetical protein
MEWFALLRGYEDDERPHYVSRSGDLTPHEWWNFDEGKRIDNWQGIAWIRSISSDEDAPPDDGLVNHLALLIVSSRMRRTVEGAGITGVQYLPIRVLKSDGTEYPDYSIANILNFPSALDFDESDFSVVPEDYFAQEDRGKISSVRKVVLRESVLQGFDIVRLKDFPEAVFVSHKFHDIYVNNKLTGYSFSRVNIRES